MKQITEKYCAEIVTEFHHNYGAEKYQEIKKNINKNMSPQL